LTGVSNHLAKGINAIGSAEHLTWQNSEVRRDSAFEHGSVTYWHYAHNEDGVPNYDIGSRYATRGADSKTAAVEAASIFHQFLNVIVMEGA
jgi:hypothetical protein